MCKGRTSDKPVRKNKRRKQAFDKTKGMQQVDKTDEQCASRFQLEPLFNQSPCEFCGALKFPRETANFCCNKNKIKVPKPEVPDLLKELLLHDNDFLRNIRSYNNALCLASLGVEGKVKDLWSTFQFQGRAYHYIGDLKPADGDGRQFAQWYIHDGELSKEQEAQGRIDGQLQSVRNRLNKETMVKLQEMLKEKNHLVKQLRFVSQLPEEQIEGKKFVLCAEGRPEGTHERTYNLPDADGDEVALVSLNDSTRPQDIQIYFKDGHIQRINPLNAHHDALHNTLLFPYGDTTWHPKLKGDTYPTSSPLQYYRHLFNVFDPNNHFNGILRSGKLMAEFACASWFKVETCRLDYQRKHQKELKAERYQGLVDALNAEEDPTKVGQKIILAPSHTGSPRWYQSKFQDCMAIVRKYGKPHYFVTFTAFGQWDDVKANVFEGQETTRRPDIVVRVFHEKLQE